jgi:hypothetical protein
VKQTIVGASIVLRGSFSCLVISRHIGAVDRLTSLIAADDVNDSAAARSQHLLCLGDHA